jgi:adenine-specific DNA methylase
MIERWFPCREVSEASSKGWGSGNSEANLFVWFAKRPIAQARAAVLTSLLPWPDDETEQRRLKALVRKTLTGYNEGLSEVRSEIERYIGETPTVLDPFSGRAMIPMEAARVGLKSWGIDYAPVAVLAGTLLADYPLREWDAEPELPFTASSSTLIDDRRVDDVETVLREVDRRWTAAMAPFYPRVAGRQPWGYLCAVTLPCQECGRRFPLVGSLALRLPVKRTHDPGQSYELVTDNATGSFRALVHDGQPRGVPTRVLPAGQSKNSSKGKNGVCPFCGHVHQKNVLERLADSQLGEDALIVAADLDSDREKVFREPTAEEFQAFEDARHAVLVEPSFGPGLPAVPEEKIPPGNTWTIQASLFGARTYGDLCNARQTLGFVKLSRAIAEVGEELLRAGVSHDYAQALCGYAGATMARKLRRATRGARLQTSGGSRVGDLFYTESSLGFAYDYFEAGLGDGPGTFLSLAKDTIAVLRGQARRKVSRPAMIQHGSALSLPMRDRTVSAVVTDPPYDDMIDYTDASDLFFVWLKRALSTTDAELVLASVDGLQDKAEEIIVKKGGAGAGDHRDRKFYDTNIARAFSEAKRVVVEDGVVTIVFGHGDPDVWHRLLMAVTAAGLVLTGSWPARTERGGGAGSANIVTTLTLACRPAPEGRQPGRVAEVDAEVRREIQKRLPLWDAAGLALTDQLMASAGPAMEVVGRYSKVENKVGNPVALDRYLPLARQIVQEVADIRIDGLPLGTFDERTRFALFWVKVFGRAITPGSEARWQRLAADLDEAATHGIVVKDGKGVRLAYASESACSPDAIDPLTPVFDVALAMAAEGKRLSHAAEVLIAADKIEDPYVWAAVRALSDAVPEADRDGESWTYLVRHRQAVASTTRNVAVARQRELEDAEKASAQGTLELGDD